MWDHREFPFLFCLRSLYSVSIAAAPVHVSISRIPEFLSFSFILHLSEPLSFPPFKQVILASVREYLVILGLRRDLEHFICISGLSPLQRYLPLSFIHYSSWGFLVFLLLVELIE